MSNWYKFSHLKDVKFQRNSYLKDVKNQRFSRQKITILPQVRKTMDSLGWLDTFTKKLEDIRSVGKSGIYRIFLEESYGGREFNVRVEASPQEMRVVEILPLSLKDTVTQLG